ncbi:pteridine reductase [Haliea sp. E17]|uniref:pteridine reductase n=1 Tax=Haliea sp. E17 TaxID=3401576 RepID=UPI003AABC08E
MPQVALITGGARRIGRAITLCLHAAGYDIALHYRSSAADAEALAAQLNARRSASCDLFAADLADHSQVQALGDAVSARYAALDLLVNNASGFEPTPLENCTPAAFDAMLDSNLRGAYFLTQALLAPLRSAGGCIVNVIDTHVQRPLPQFNAYGAAKAGLASLTRSFAVELGPQIRVNGVSPGAILWPEDDAAYDAETRKATIEATPLKRLGAPEDIARTVLFLAREAPFITGQVIAVDGGRGLT